MAILNIYKHLRRPTNTTAGLSDEILIAPVSWFESIAEPADSTNINLANTILESHEFKPGRGFIRVQCAPFKNILNTSHIGEQGNSTMEQVLSITVPGSYSQLHATLSSFMQQPLIVLFRDGNCAANTWYQLGCRCSYAWLAPSFSTGEPKSGMKGYKVDVRYVGEIVQFYAGNIHYAPDISVIDFMLIGNQLVAVGDQDDLDNLDVTFEIDENGMLLMHGTPPAGYNFDLVGNQLVLTYP